MNEEDWKDIKKRAKRKKIKFKFLYYFQLLRITLYALALLVCIVNALLTQSTYYAAMAVFFLLMLKWETFG